MQIRQRLTVRSLGPETAPAGKLHFHGSVITPDDFFRKGTVVAANGRIERVCSTPEPAEPGDVDVDTGGLICPGFVDTHNHAAYAAFRRWTRPARYFSSRFDWRGKTRCRVFVVPQPDPYYADNVAAPYKAMTTGHDILASLMLYGQVRGLLGGATTMAIDADLDPDQPTPRLPGFTRDPSDWPGRVWGVLDVGCVDAPTLKRIVDDLQTAPTSGSHHAKLLVHIGEGVDAQSRGEFTSLVAKDLLTEHTALIHAMGLLDADWQAVRAKGASLIWSPVSNFRLYGRSLDIGMVLGLGIRTALAPDWTISGSSTLLDELRFVRTRYKAITPEQLLSMCTSVPASIVGMPELGRISPGCFADLLVFKAEPESRLEAADVATSASIEDIALAVVGGAAVYGIEALVSKAPDLGSSTERISVPGPNGSLDRVVRVGAQAPWSAAIAQLNASFKEQHLEVAPLWELG